MVKERAAAETVDHGLEDIAVVTSSICSIDGERGTLRYRGYDIAELAASATFEEVAHLLWYGELPSASQLEHLRHQLAAERALPEPVVDFMRAQAPDANSMAVLRTAVSALALHDPEANDVSHDTNMRHAARLTGQMGPLVATWGRLSQGLDPVAPDPGLSIAGNFLYQLHGKQPAPHEVRAFDIALVLHADHELNASTFAARVTAATLSDMYSAVTSAIGTLKGPLHGGANEAVMHMLEKIGTVEAADGYVSAALERRERLMGFGHRVYRVEDPRATQLRKLSQEFGVSSGEPKWYDISRAVEDAVKRRRGLNPNVDFYSASLYHTLRIPVELFTPVFAVSRISGWTAHVLEQYDHNRLIRPRAEYTGTVERHFVAVEGR